MKSITTLSHFVHDKKILSMIKKKDKGINLEI